MKNAGDMTAGRNQEHSAEASRGSDADCCCFLPNYVGHLFKDETFDDAINKRNITFLHNIMLSTNAPCKMCHGYAENELQ